MKGLHNKVRKKDSHVYTIIKGTLGIFAHMYNLIIFYVVSDLSLSRNYFSEFRKFSKECIEEHKKK